MSSETHFSRIPVGYRFYWDSHCRLCNSLKKIGEMLDWRQRVTFVPLESDPAEIDLGHMSYDEKMASSHLVTPDGRVYSRGEGILGLAQLLPLLTPAVFCFRLLPFNQALAERLYNVVARNRGVPYGGSCKIEFGPPRGQSSESSE